MGMLICVECKPEDSLLDPQVARRHLAIQLCLAASNVRFIEVTDRDLAGEHANCNVDLLLKCLRTSRSRVERAADVALIAGAQPMCFEELQQLLGAERALRALAEGLAFFDIHQPLTGSSALVPLQKAIDATHFLFP